MFLENDYALPLFDFEKGGSPKAFKCLDTECNKVTRTERGMRMHLKLIHGWEEQLCLYSTASQKQARERRKSGPRMSDIKRTTEKILKKHSLIPDTEQEVEATQKPQPPIEPETSGQQLLKLTSEEK